MPSPDYGNVPAQPQYGEVKQMEEQAAAAPMPTQEAVPPPAEGQPIPPEAAPETVAPQAPSPNNIVDVLPPLSTSPAVTGAPPIDPESQLAYLILGTPGMGRLARTLAAQIVGKFPEESVIPEQQLTEQQLAQYQMEQMKVATPEVK
jgi:hypothetical protein